MFHFQIVADTTKEAEKFMESVSATNVDIEEWEYQSTQALDVTTEVYGFAVTCYSPKRLNRLADSLGVALIYIESDRQLDQRVQSLLQRSGIRESTL